MLLSLEEEDGSGNYFKSSQPLGELKTDILANVSPCTIILVAPSSYVNLNLLYNTYIIERVYLQYDAFRTAILPGMRDSIYIGRRKI